jgi:hydroxypyruvate isomerase
MNSHPLTRRQALKAAGAAALAAPLSGQNQTKTGEPVPPASASTGRINQSAARWCYRKYSIDDLCQNAKRIGLKGIDLVNHEDWPTVQKFGLVPAMTPGSGTIPVGWNRKENHDKLVAEMTENLGRASAAGVPNVITFSGSRNGLPDSEGIENTIGMELLNSKIDHHDYQCDHTVWGVAVVKAVDSPRVKLLYDIYHMQIMEGDIVRTIRQNINYIAHFHTGGVPGRNELDQTQELQWRTVATAIADLGFKGYFAHEFNPTAADPMKSLEQAYQLCNV